jgi:hypothetical protein
MILKLTDILLKDFIYKQNPDYSYEFNSDGSFTQEDRNAIIDTILATLKRIYSNIVTHNNLNPGKIECNDYLLAQALSRYSRDIFGEIRLWARIDHISKLGRITDTHREQLTQFSDYGLKIDSCSPYIHRQIAVLLYWLSVLKPFAIYPEDSSVVKSLGVAFEFHNEYMSYLLCLSFLKVFNHCLNIHNNRDRFYDFLYDLHYRNISRSSLEFFMGGHIKKIKAGPQP